uniref:Autophagy-related protein 101 n=1 Tax=Anopheles triannulatus TaxID=58253 RepID=A0A2M4ARZ4_9DIPT
MNARSHTFALRLEPCQLEEATASIFHTILFHRSLGKFRIIDRSSYTAGSLGYQEVDCRLIDLTYIRCNSQSLDQTVGRQLVAFSRQMHACGGSGSGGQISLEFYQRRRNRWHTYQTAASCFPWEVWSVQLELVELRDERERELCRDRLGDTLREMICGIVEAVGRDDYLPDVPCRNELHMVYDTSYPDVQPYLFQFRNTTQGVTVPSFGAAVGKTLQKLMDPFG